METITLVYLPNLSEEQIELLVQFSNKVVGIVGAIQNGETVIYHRYVGITLEDLESNGFSVWEFPARQNTEAPFEFSNGEVQTALVQLKTPAFDCILTSGPIFQVLNRQLEFQES